MQTIKALHSTVRLDADYKGWFILLRKMLYVSYGEPSTSLESLTDLRKFFTNIFQSLRRGETVMARAVIGPLNTLALKALHPP